MERSQSQVNFWGTLKVIIDETFMITNEYKEIIVLCYSGLAIDHSMEKWESIYQPYYHWLEEILNKAINRGEIMDDTNIGWTAKTIINLIENAAERFYIGHSQDDRLEDYKMEVFHFIKRSLIRT